MTPAGRIRQEQACHIRFKQLRRDGVMPEGLTAYEYAETVLGRRVDTLKALSDSELNALRDALEGKPSKVREKMYAAAKAAGIERLDRWMQVLAKKNPWLRGHTPETLPHSKAWRLVKLLERRR